MLRILRITLMWLVVLAIPAQGYAAAAMVGCGPGHHSMLAAPSHADAMAERDAPIHAFDASLEADSDPHHAGSAESDHGQLTKSHGSAAKGAKGSCSPCASCCVVAALPTTVMVFEPLPLVDFFVPLAPRSVASFVTDGLDRPPRFVRA